MSVTIKQIAERSGLSIQTVSQILNDKGSAYRPDTCERVRQAARELGYMPNASARAMRRGRFGVVALLLATDGARSILLEPLLNGIYEALDAQDLHLTIARLPDDKLTNEGYVPKILREWSADGLLINYNAEIPARMVELIERYSLPAIWINSKQPADCVYPDDREASRQATEYLIALGHRRIAFGNLVGCPHYSAFDRWEGYCQAMQNAGLEPIRADELRTAPADWLRQADRPTAVLTYNLHIATPLLYAAASSGVAIPEALSVLTFNEAVDHSLGRPIDAMLLPEYALGQKAVQMLLEKLEHRPRKLPPCAIPLTLAGGWTTARAPQ